MAVKSTVNHKVEAGDGIRCWVVSSRHGVLKSEVVHHGRKTLDVDSIDVKAGDRIDFVVDLREGLNSDEFLWAPKIRPLPKSDGSPSWDAARDFAGPKPPRLTPWEQLAQVLLLSNETMFVD